MPKLSNTQHDVTSLSNVADDLKMIVNDLQETISLMREHDISRTVIRFDGEMRRSLRYLPRFAESARHYVRTKLLDDGARYRSQRTSAQRRTPARTESQPIQDS